MINTSKRRWNGITFLGMVSSFALVVALPAYGQDAPVSDPDIESNDAAEEERVEDAIIVLGTKLGLTVQETTTSAEIFDSERLDQESLFNLGDLVVRTPNVTGTEDNLNNISIRGINRNGTGGAGQSEAVNIYIDGAPASANALFGFQSLWDIAQVEVLRGSQSTVQGRNAIGGAVVVQSKNPTFEWEGAARLRFAEFGTAQYAGAISGPIIDDQLAFRLSVDYQESDGFIRETGTDELVDGRETLGIRGKLLAEPNFLPKFSGLITVDYSDRETGLNQLLFGPGPANEPDFANFDPGDRLTNPRLRFADERETVRVITDLSYELTESIDLKALGTFEDATSFVGRTDLEPSPFGDLAFETDASARTYTAELRAEFDFNKLSGLIGGYYFLNDTESDFVSTEFIMDMTPFPPDPLNSIFSQQTITATETENFAFFTSLRFEPNEKWDLEFGLRYDNERFTTMTNVPGFTITPEDCTIDIPGAVLGTPEVPIVTLLCTVAGQLIVPPPQPLQSDEFDVVLPRGAVTYNVTEDLSVFMGLRRGYRAGGTFLGVSEFLNNFQVITFDPEFLLTYEAGWRSQWLDKKLTVNGTAFYSEYEDQQVTITDAQGFQLTTNAGETLLFGLELSVDYLVTDELNLYGSLGLLETEIQQFDFSFTGGTELDLSGNELASSPNVSFTIGATYAHSSGLFADGSFNFQGPSESDFLNFGPEDLGEGLTEEVGSSSVLNVRFGYRRENVTISVFATNLLGEDEPVLINLAGPAFINDPTANDAFFDPPSFNVRSPQTFGISLDLSF
ncbi:MAG: TonB-dependent receptor [Pseudomonadota bacterium]